MESTLLRVNIIFFKDLLSKDSVQRAGSSTLISSWDWKLLWRCFCPPKVLLFLWRGCSGALATNEACFKRRCNVNPICPICGLEEETIEHALLLCDYAAKVWFGSPLSIRIDRSRITSFHAWLEDMLKCGKGDWEFVSCVIGFFCWQIWRCRCAFVFEHTEVISESIISVISFLVFEFIDKVGKKEVESVVFAEVPLNSAGWDKPDVNCLKLNCDGAFDHSSSDVAVGVVVRDSFGNLVDGFCGSVLAFSAFMAESLALSKAISLAKGLVLEFALFESDCFGLVQWVNNGALGPWECTHLVDEVSAVLQSKPHWKLQFVRRCANLATDKVANMGLRRMCPLEWVSCPPSSLSCILFSDAGVEVTCVG